MALAGGITAFPRTVLSQQFVPGMKRLGYIGPLAEDDPSIGLYWTPFRANLAAQGWVEGKNLTIDYRWGKNTVELAAGAAKDIVGLKPDVVLVAGPSIREVAKLTQTIPLVFVLATQPLETGLVDSLARPSGNLTGFTAQDVSFAANELGMLLELAPDLERAGLLLGGNTVDDPLSIKVWRDASAKAGLEPVILEVATAADIVAAIARLAAGPRSGCHVSFGGTVPLANRSVVISEIGKHRLPTVYGNVLYGPDGGLVSYSADVFDVFGRGGDYVGRILNGTRVADLPVQQPTKYTLIVNLKTAKVQGITIPNSILVRANQVIE